jgi:hypothetical protein
LNAFVVLLSRLIVRVVTAHNDPTMCWRAGVRHVVIDNSASHHGVIRDKPV